MRMLLRSFCVFALLTGLALHAGAFAIGERHKLTLSHTLLVYDNRITGSNKAGSFLTPGTFFTDDLGLNYGYTKEENVFEANAEGRAADDDRVQQKRFLLKSAYLKFDNAENSFITGDYLASLSPYSLNTSLKGARYTRKVGSTFEATVLTGYDKPEWEEVWNHNESENIDRRFYGMRLAKRFGAEAMLGLNGVWSKDTHSHYNTASVVEDQRVFAADWALPAFWGLRLTGESAFSHTEHDNPTPALDPDGIEDPTTSDFTKQGYAHKVAAEFSHGRFKSSNNFERVSPRYATTGGASSPDLIQANTQNTLDIMGPWKWVVLNYTWFHDNLENNTISPRTTTRMPETGFRFEGPDARPTFSIESKVRQREVTASDTGLRSRSRSVVSSMSDRLGPLSVTVDYEFQHEDKSDAQQSARHHILGLAGAAVFSSAKGWKLSPAARWNLQRDRDNLTVLTEQTGGLTANLNAESPWGIDASGGYSRNLVLATAPEAGSDRRTYSATLGWNILKSADHRLELRYRQNDNIFEAPAQDFKEIIVQASLTNRF